MSTSSRSSSSVEQKLLSTGIPFSSLPESYIRPPSQRPQLSQVKVLHGIPVIDLNSPAAHDHLQYSSNIIDAVRHACTNYGFFQVANHGMAEEVVERMLRVSREFFDLPMEEKLKLYSDDPAKKLRLSTSFNIKKETINNWRDYLRLHCYPLEEFIQDWPSNPPDFRDAVGEYSSEVRKLSERVMQLISLSLGLKAEYLYESLGTQGQHMAINYYPQCPEPELTYGLPAHTDPNALTILLQDGTPGLQVLRDGKWTAINPLPNAFVVNIGDQLQALSNGRYKSVWHRAVVNSNKERMSVAVFLCPQNDSVLAAAEELVKEGGRVYRSYTYDEYYKKFWSRTLDDDHCLEFFKNTHT